MINLLIMGCSPVTGRAKPTRGVTRTNHCTRSLSFPSRCWSHNHQTILVFGLQSIGYIDSLQTSCRSPTEQFYSRLSQNPTMLPCAIFVIQPLLFWTTFWSIKFVLNFLPDAHSNSSSENLTAWWSSYHVLLGPRSLPTFWLRLLSSQDYPPFNFIDEHVLDELSLKTIVVYTSMNQLFVVISSILQASNCLPCMAMTFTNS